MIRLETAAGGLDLTAGSITLELANSFFSFDSVPGTTTYPFTIPLTDNNAIRLNFPHIRAEQGQKVEPEPVLFFIEELLWRRGSLVYRDFDEEKELLQYHFVADATDLQSKIEGLSLATMDLGEVPWVVTATAADYAMPVVQNTAFFGEKNPLYKGYLNYYRNGAYLAATDPNAHFLTPFLRLIPLLRRVMAALGYSVSGPWLDSAEAQKLVVYSDRVATPTLFGKLQLNRHVPDMGPGQFLIALQKLLGLGYDFNPVRNELLITRLSDVVADHSYIDRVGGVARTTPAEGLGFTLKLELLDDELNKTLDTSWSTFKVGAGKTVVDCGAGTLHMVKGKDLLQPTVRQWLTPAVSAPGAGDVYELSPESRASLMLLFDRGLQPDSTGALYPLATSGAETWAGTSIGTDTLHWAGPKGLYQRHHQAWLSFLDSASTSERTMQFDVADLLTLTPARKEMVGMRKYLWQKISLSIPTASRLETARFTYRSIRL
ncbi:hypothetical protein [Hymenobacter chitinivorans]|uniref:Uncharacterized protein n=1 Tax=Hymenobacter chitinivorans DSM 11115 TaxID=1121954 RepID=A0A2M9BNC7_9BACT|nr:hypothetical protein [Hymenobacter chitinivorans]PJJ59449.1 hypothetical protein CLV45_0866 [Hymenobacter chitinivorans DSM 11115]